MRKYMLIALVAMGVLGTTCATAQDMQGPKTEKKEKKLDKKTNKMDKAARKGSERKADRKEEKAVKKGDKAEIKEEKVKYAPEHTLKAKPQHNAAALLCLYFIDYAIPAATSLKCSLPIKGLLQRGGRYCTFRAGRQRWVQV